MRQPGEPVARHARQCAIRAERAPVGIETDDTFEFCVGHQDLAVAAELDLAVPLVPSGNGSLGLEQDDAGGGIAQEIGLDVVAGKGGRGDGFEKQLGPPLLAEAGVGDEQLAEFAGAEIACHDVVLEPLLTRRQGQGESRRRRLERGVEGDGGKAPDAAGGEFGFDHPGRCHRRAAVVFGQGVDPSG